MLADYDSLDAQSRVWIYQSNKVLRSEQVQLLKNQLDGFLVQWTSHNQALRAWGDVLHNRFIVFIVDERFASTSGCSIDKSVVFLQTVEQNFDLDLFDRWNFAYQGDTGVETAHKTQFAALYSSGKINDTTLVFNNLVKTKSEFETKWKISLADSWHKRMLR